MKNTVSQAIKIESSRKCDLETITVEASLSVSGAFARIESGGVGVLLLVDKEGKLKRTITDGDLRRLLLSGKGVDESLATLEDREPIVADAEISEKDALAILNEHQIDHLPILDGQGKPCGLLLRRELDQKILLSTPHLGEYEMEYIEEAFRTNWIAPLGPNVNAFEREIADYVGAADAAALSSGTAALHLALRVLGVGTNDTVFCSSLTFVASVNPILYQNARPVFIDSDPENWNMSVPALKQAMKDADRSGRLPKAVIVVNIYGQSADFDTILDLCNHYGVPVIEDAAESLGASYKGRHSGTLGLLGVYSFNGNKIITTSGGGMLVSDDQSLIEHARSLSTQAREETPWYEHAEVGYNYRMSNVLAGIGRGQLKVLEDRVNTRRSIFDRYRDGLSGVSQIDWMPEAEFGQSTRWLSVFRLKSDSHTPSKIVEALGRLSIEARHVWKPMHCQPLLKDCKYFSHSRGESFSDAAFSTGVCLPSGSNMTVAQQNKVISSIRSLF